MIINNSMAGHAYGAYVNNLNNLTKSAARLSTGEKYPDAASGKGILGKADRMKLQALGTSSLLESIENTKGFVQTQDAILNTVSDIMNTMMELASASLAADNNTERVNLNYEFEQLQNEIANLYSVTYNDKSLWGAGSLQVRFGLATTQEHTLSGIRFDQFSIIPSIATMSSASAAVISLLAKVGSLAALKGQVVGHIGIIERTLDYSSSYVTNLTAAESVLRNVDIAQESAEFTKQQMILSASEAALAALNQMPQRAQRFLNF